MEKILINIHKDNITFSECSKDLSNKELNNTNIIDTNNIVFTVDYLTQNLDLVAAFVKVIVLKKNISKAYIKHYSIAPYVLDLLKLIPEFTDVIFIPKATLPHLVYEKLNEHKYFDNIECYNMTEYMFEDLNRRGYHVELQNKIFFISDFMYHDNLKTYSDLYYKKVLKIDFILDDTDALEFEAFLKINNFLRVIEITYYNKESLNKIINILNKYRKRNIKIHIFEKDKNIIPDIDYLHVLKKQNKNLKFKIIYSDKYKNENRLKQLNLNLLKVIILVIILTIAGIFIINLTEQKEAETLSKKIVNVKEKIVKEEEETPEAPEENKDTPFIETTYNKKYSRVWDELLKINNETIGWLTVNNTNIDYPVVKHSDNDFYLKHDFNKEQNRYGWLFADYQNKITPLDQNTIIYGHDSGSVMFSGLYRTKNKKWYTNKSNQIITFNTKEQNSTWQIFSIYAIDNTNDYLYIQFESNEAFMNYINKVKGRSIYNFGVNVGANDKILTLSTCYGNKQKLVIHAKKIS